MTAPFFVAFPFWGCHAERSEASPSKRFCMRSLTCVRDDIEIPCRAIALGNDVILTTARRKNLF